MMDHMQMLELGRIKKQKRVKTEGCSCLRTTSHLLPLYGGSGNLAAGTWQAVRPSARRVSNVR